MSGTDIELLLSRGGAATGGKMPTVTWDYPLLPVPTGPLPLVGPAAGRVVRRLGEHGGRDLRRARTRYARVMSPDEVPFGDSRLAELVAALSEAEALLRQRGDGHWADWLERDRVRIAARDAFGLDHVKQAFGGMGSINDTYPADDDEVGAKLAKIYTLAAQLFADW